MPDRRSGHDLSPGRGEIEEEQPPPSQPEDVRATYPPDAFALWYNRFPLKEARKKAEAAFDKVQASGAASFPDLMSGLERYIRDKPRSQDWCYPATWLTAERWRDGVPVPIEAPACGSGPPNASSVFVRIDTEDWEAWRKEAVRRGRVGWPVTQTSEGRGWRFPSARPPGDGPNMPGGS